MKLDDLLIQVESYLTIDEISKIKEAYKYADTLHDGQMRESGDPYITHPLTVASILAEMNADCDTICAALLHDTLEDTSATKEEINELFGKEVANLVDGVTKLAKMNFSSKTERNLANTRKIITGITSDVRIIFIKLADRLHNMRTLEFKKSKYKRIENSMETLDLYAPLAYYLGAYKIKNELEDLSLKYTKPDSYFEIEEKRRKIENSSREYLNEMLATIEMTLEKEGLPNEIRPRTKNIYGIFRRQTEGQRLYDIHDLFSLRVLVHEIKECYLALGYVHNIYKPINERFKDYICNPKTNMYQSIHTTVYGPDSMLVQVKLRTYEMHKVSSYGLIASWDSKNPERAREKMQKELKEKYQFYDSLMEMNSIFSDNSDFIHQVRRELLADKVYVYTTKGEVKELPKGATIIDFAYSINSNLANTMISAMVNDEPVQLDYVLKNQDRVKIITDELSYGPRDGWVDKAVTTHAKTKIKEFNKK